MLVEIKDNVFINSNTVCSYSIVASTRSGFNPSDKLDLEKKLASVQGYLSPELKAEESMLLAEIKKYTVYVIQFSFMYSPNIMVGKLFDTIEEARAFLLDNFQEPKLVMGEALELRSAPACSRCCAHADDNIKDIMGLRSPIKHPSDYDPILPKNKV